MSAEHRILILEESPEEAERIQDVLRRGGVPFQARVAAARGEFERALRESPPDVVIADTTVRGLSGLAALELLRQIAPKVPFILVSSSIDLKTAALYLKAGTLEYVNKENLGQLPHAVRTALDPDPAPRRETGERYRRMVEFSPDGILIQREGLVVYANSAALSLLRAPALEALQGKPVIDFVHPEFAGVVAERIAQLGAGQRAVPPIEEKWVRMDGSAVDVEVAANSFLYEGKPAVEVTLRDISARKRAQRALFHRTRQQGAVSDLSQRALADANIPRLMRKAAELAARTLDLDCSAILEILPERTGFLLREGFGWKDLIPESGAPHPMKDSPAGLAFQSGSPVTFEDLNADVRFKPPSLLQARGVVAGLCIPIPAREQAFGVLGVYSTAPRTFSVDDLHFVQSIANVLGAAMERRRLEMRLTVQNAATRILAEARELSEVGIRIVQEVCATLGWDAGALWTHDPSRNALRCLEFWHSPLTPLAEFSAASRRLSLGPGVGFPGYVWAQMAPVWIEDFSKDARFPRAAAARREGIRAAMGIPISAGSALLGVLEFFSTETRTVDKELLSILELIGHQVGLYLERRRAEEALRESEERYRRLVELSPDAVFVLREGRFVYVNSAGVKLFGSAGAEDLLGKPLLDFVHPSERDGLMRELREMGREGRALPPTSHRYRRLDGSFADVEVAALEISFQRRPGLLLVARDVTTRQQLEDQLRQAQRMEAVGRLAGGVAHDFNNLLTAISGYGQLLRSSLPADHPQRPFVDEILKAGDKAATLTRQLLAFSRKQILEPKILDLNAVVADMEGMLRRLIGEDIELKTLPGASLGRVKADPGQIQQVIMNLVVNARDAMPRGGKLTLGTASVDLDATFSRDQHDFLPGPYVMLTVSDTGVGMDDETLVHLFEPFFTTKGPGKGTGLGLSTVYGIVKQSGGYITVYSEVGRGTTFRVYLPRVEGQPESRPASGTYAAQPGGTETVLLVEDSDVVRKLTREILLSQGYTVLEARNGTEAIRLCEQRREPIDLILTDVVMPELGGRELAEKVTAIRPGLKVLFMSGYAEDAIAHHGILDPGAAFVSKPFTPSALSSKVREILDHPAVQGPPSAVHSPGPPPASEAGPPPPPPPRP